MNQLDTISICRVIDRLAMTRAISLDSRNEFFGLLGIKKERVEYPRGDASFVKQAAKPRQYQLHGSEEDSQNESRIS